MKIKVATWSISKICGLKDKIQDQPRYQRGDVWSPTKKRLLIDSILRDIDIPKLYLRRLTNSPFQYEVADGQQRLKTIFMFKNDGLKLESRRDNGLDLSKIDKHDVGGLHYSELPTELRRRFDKFGLTVAIVENSTNSQIRTLFGRLQLGTPLNPAEKRNAIISHVGNHIDNFVLNHDFFQSSKIPKERFKHQDYLAHALTLLKYKNKKDLKAVLIEELYLDQDVRYGQDELRDISRVLDSMGKINNECNKRITNKFAFIDIFMLLYNHRRGLENLDVVGFARDFVAFENERLANKENPKDLLKKKSGQRRNAMLYDYIMAFRSEGATATNIATREKVFEFIFMKHFKK